jgi:ribose transport system ATP-binding protein
MEDNISITIWEKYASRVLHVSDINKEKRVCSEMVSDLQIKTTGMKQIVNNLSGGNQQKVSIAKWLAAKCDILIIDEPTVGVDVGAKEFIHQLIWNLAKVEKKSIILISSDMPELIKLSRRICIFRSGKIVGEIDDLNNMEEKSYKIVSEHIGKYLV